MFKTPNEIQFVDPNCNLILPWYTKPCLDKLLTLDFKNWEVFEWEGDVQQYGTRTIVNMSIR